MQIAFGDNPWHSAGMKLAETVMLGGAGFDRAAHLRADPQPHLQSAHARALVIWQGKPLIFGDSSLVFLALDHDLLASRLDTSIFLGLDPLERPTFAIELDDWSPDSVQQIDSSFFDSTRQTHPSVPNAEFVELRSLLTDLSVLDAELAATARGIFEWHRTHQFCAKCGAKSEMTMAGWQRDCPSCGGHHFPRTDPVVIMLITHGNSVLIGRSPGWPEGMYSLLAGFMEPGETMEAAVRREVMEETGIEVGAVEYLASQPWPFPSSLMFGCAGEALTTTIDIDPNEIEAAHWVTREEMAIVFAGQHPFVNPPRKGAIAGFLLEKWLSDSLT